MRAFWVVWAVWAISGCNKSPVETVKPIAGSETHWLRSCDTDAECGDANACVCGICTRPCAANTCSLLGDDTVCVPPDSAAAIALCGALPAEATGVCAAECAGPANCAAGYTCEANVCVPGEVEERPLQRISQRSQVRGPTKLDLLFVIDNSGSMCQEQRALSTAFAEIVEAFTDIDYRIAVVSTDLQNAEQRGQFLAKPTLPVASLNCRDLDDEPIVPDTADCAALYETLADPALIRSDLMPDDATLARWFRCNTTLGTGGDGFEKGMGAVVRATQCNGPNADRFAACCTAEETFDPTCQQPGPAPEFLRPDAQLAVVFVTDENDCTDATDTPALSQFPICRADPDTDEIPAEYATHCGADVTAEACYRRDCGDSDREECRLERCVISRRDNSNCEWYRDTLVSIENIAGALKGLKRNPSDVAVWAFAAPDAVTDAGDPIRFDPGEPAEMCMQPFDDVDACCPNGRCISEIQVSCESALGSAFSGHRYQALADAMPFGCGPAEGCSICADTLDLSPALGQVVDARFSVCLTGRPACFTGPELTRCADAESRNNLDNYTIRAELDGVPMQRGVDWELQINEGCPTGMLFVPLAPEALPVGGSIQLLYAR